MSDSQEIDALFQHYLQVCNAAMDRHKNEFPYKYIWEAVEKLQAGEEVDLTVYDDAPQRHYRVRLKDKQIEVVQSDKDERHKGWKMNTSYLRKVTEHPQEYVEHPARLDWDWLKDRAGL